MIFGPLSFIGCGGQPLVLLWNTRVKSQMPITPEHAFKEKSTKLLILLPLRTTQKLLCLHCYVDHRFWSDRSSDSILRTVVHTVRELQLWSKEIEWRHPSTKGSYCAFVCCLTKQPETLKPWLLLERPFFRPQVWQSNSSLETCKVSRETNWPFDTHKLCF